MPESTFRGDPYHVLGVAHDASSAVIKRRWRALAQEHHPDRAGGDGERAHSSTTRMARINAAYDLLRDPVRRARHDALPQARRASDAEARSGTPTDEEPGRSRRPGPPAPPPTRPVTARFDTSAAFHRRNATTHPGRTPLPGHPPLSRDREGGPDLRASTPTGPVARRASGSSPQIPTLDEARSTILEFGRFHGYTLGDVAQLEATYIDWIAQTITRDRDLVRAARVIQADLDERGISRDVRAPRPGFGSSRMDQERSSAGASAPG
jgi:curved DNA-binding protein CbpA